MPETPHCPVHQRYIRNGTCVDCERRVREAVEAERARIVVLGRVRVEYLKWHGEDTTGSNAVRSFIDDVEGIDHG